MDNIAAVQDWLKGELKGVDNADTQIAMIMEDLINFKGPEQFDIWMTNIKKRLSKYPDVLKGKKRIPEPIEKLWGVRTDPFQRYVLGLNKTASLVAQVRFLDELAKAGVRIGISSRATGSVEHDMKEDAYMVQDNLRMITWDMVADPSCQNAFPTSITL